MNRIWSFPLRHSQSRGRGKHEREQLEHGVMGQGDTAEQQPGEPEGEVVDIAQGSKGKLYRKGKVRVQC